VSDLERLKIPDVIARAIAAQGKVSVEEVAEKVAAGNAIPPDEVDAAEARGDWRSLVEQTPEEESLSEQEQAMIQPSLEDDVA
jgi:hypothetical protein